MKSALHCMGISVTRFPPRHLLPWLVKNFIHDTDVNLVLDVGAFHGGYCKMLRSEVRYTGRIASFEPCAESFGILSAEMLRDKNWRGYQIGLSDRDSAAVLNKYDQGDFNSLLTIREKAKHAYGVERNPRAAEAVQLCRIDTIWDEITEGVESPRVFLKTDAQGYDTTVVLGAASHLEHIVGIQSELPVVGIYDGMVSMAEALELYGNLGYLPVGFYPLGVREAYGLSPEFDVVFKRIGNAAWAQADTDEVEVMANKGQSGIRQGEFGVGQASNRNMIQAIWRSKWQYVEN